MGVVDMLKNLVAAIEANDHAAVAALVEESRHSIYDRDVSGDGERPIHLAAAKGRTELCRLLLGSKVDRPGRGGDTPLVRACQHGHLDTVRFLLEYGADTEASEIRTPLHAAVAGKYTEIVPALVAAGAKPNVYDSFGVSPIHEAVRKGVKPIVESLIEAGAHVIEADSESNAPLHIAAACGRIERCALLIQNGADVWQTNDDGALPGASRGSPDWDADDDESIDVTSYFEALRMQGPHFIAAGATEKYLTPFQHAVRRGDAKYVRHVLASDPTVDLDAKTLGGRTLMELGCEYMEIQNLLRSARSQKAIAAELEVRLFTAGPAPGSPRGRTGLESL
jgi:ankyrin repeat protein